jgi:hypothetical protein
MEDVLRFFRTNEVWVYLLLGLVGLIYIRKFMLAWQELRGAAFGLERDRAQSRLNQSAGMLALLFTVAVVEFVAVSFIAPSIPGATPLLTPTLDLLATPTYTLAAPAQSTLAPGETQQAAPTPAETPTPTGGGCIPDQIVISSPKEGDEIGGAVDVQGTVNVPDFGFYKLEMKQPEETTWLTILAGNQLRQNASLGTWNTSLLSPGNYQLSLVVTDNQSHILPACIVQVRVIAASTTAQP